MSVPAGPTSLPAQRACLIVLDGWGLAQPGPGNAVELAHTPVFDELWAEYPHTTLVTWGRAVGLPEGQMGNSEVGHLNLGAGSVVRQDLVRIDDLLADGTLAADPKLRRAFLGDGQAPRRVHLIGLVSDGGVHSSIEHLVKLAAIGRELGAQDVVLHAFTDGRDTLPHAGGGYLARMDAEPGVRVGSVVGRYWAMDRDRRWDRVQRAYDLLVLGRAEHHAPSGEQAVREAYERGETDEFIEPTLVGEDSRIGPHDSVICFNFRPDRMREITRALAEPGFGDAAEDLPGWRGCDGGEPPAFYTTLTRYDEHQTYPVLVDPERPSTTIGRVIAARGETQLHVAETEKYPHVTYFFNGGDEDELSGERRELVSSPRDVATYDEKPQMSAHEAADAFVSAWREAPPRFGIINFANADMVGHTGVIPAAVAAIEAVDESLGRVVAAVHESGGVCVVTADHGNADHMLEPDGSPNTQHSLNPVPLIVTSTAAAVRGEPGVLADVAPTLLALIGIQQPVEMTGASLLAG